MKVAILGFDVEGRVSFEYYRSQDHDVTICDKKADLEVPEGANTQLGEGYLDNLDRFDLLIRTPGLHPSKILDKNPGVADRIWSGTNEFLKVSPSQNIIGVTGTKGKGTTSALTAKILESAGKTVHLAGNIGRAALDILPEVKPDDWVVLELSNFQLIDLQSSPHIAACLMVVPEHLDWHKDEQEYFGAKTNLFKHQSADDIAIYFAGNKNSEVIATAGDSAATPYYAPPGTVIEDGLVRIRDQDICRVDELKLLGEHNWQNVCAAVTITWQVTQDVDAIRSALTSFSGLEHRLEFVRKVNGIKYYDDSFGTAPETAIVAIQAFKEPKVLILGGSSKGLNYDSVAKIITEANVRSTILIGETAQDIKAALESVGFSNIVLGDPSMERIVKLAAEQAQPGDVVVLSPACASFDLFQNYKDRGNQFKQAVAALVPSEADQ